MIRFNIEKVMSLRSDFSIFHPTATQVKIIYDLSKLAPQYTNCTEECFKLMLIKSEILTQQEFKIHQYEIETSPVQLRMKYSQRIITNLENILSEFLVSVTDKKDLKIFLDRIFKYYTETYAGRA